MRMLKKISITLEKNQKEGWFQ